MYSLYVMRIRPTLVTVALFSLLFTWSVVAYDLRDNPPAAEFPEGLPWLNVEGALKIADLRGKVVILDFWTYGCINCIHVMEDLKRLEVKYHDRLAVIGVHSPKFDNEKNLETLRRTLVRYERDHAVVHDTEFVLMRQYGARAWPTLIVLDPAGGIVGGISGEGHYDTLDRVVGELLEEYTGSIDDSPLPLVPETARFQDSLLAFPGKIAVSHEHVAISDTLHHRVILTDHGGKILREFGGLVAGLVDGPARQARFSAPQGLAFSGNRLYVADTGNHTIRQIDLSNGAVSTIAGTGKVGIRSLGGGAATTVNLRSPWGLAVRDGILYIAMAGDHRIWQMNLDTAGIRVYAGSGREGIGDGSLGEAEFSQPSGLSLFGDWLFVADAEDSAVRRIDLKRQMVDTLVGTGLFDFGDRDGSFEQAELQHVLGIAALDEHRVLIADTYNHKLKQLDTSKMTVKSLAGTGKPGRKFSSGQVGLNEPGGVAILKTQVLIADTNNHRIMSYDFKLGKLKEWQLSR